MLILYRSYFILLFLFFLSFDQVIAQQQRRHLIFFTDKEGTPFTVSQPEAFLSARSVQRRQAQQIAVTAKDLPVSPQYVAGIRDLGAEVIYTTKWLNGALIACTDSVLEQVRLLPYVRNSDRLTLRSSSNVDLEEKHTEQNAPQASNNFDYGASVNQVKMLGADAMHAQGYTGEGKIIAVLDAGFSNVNQLPAFQHLFDSNRFLGAYDFVANAPDSFGNHTHGTRVLSCLAANLPGQVIGTAPGASYYLFRTEEAASELKVEEAYWLMAAERADSLGVDIINSSLGYFHFDDSTMNYTIAQLDGNTSIISRAASMAAGTGMLVVNSAGNEGRDINWQGKIIFPADADSIIAVGAVQPDSLHASFSSKGPTADNRIKPDLVAQGVSVAIADVNGNVESFNGTSFSAPLLSGLAAGVWQAFPHLTNIELINLLLRSASQFEQPDNFMGYGIPSFSRLASIASAKLASWQGVKLYPTLVSDEQVHISFTADFAGRDKGAEILIADMTGKIIRQEKLTGFIPGEEQHVHIATSHLTRGMYIVRLLSKQGQATFKFVKQ